jgi:oligopeptide/dipeptide ABC transporter ATP-binding protein
VLDRFPHEMSGGMRQRAIIALALLFRPPLLVADEPTTGLDVIVQRQIVNLLVDLRRNEGLSLLFISHDIGVVAELCDRVAVLYAGEVMEEGPTAEVLASPSHPYTMGLAQSFPDIRTPDRPLVSIAGHPPRLTERPKGCPFVSRCPFARDVCRTDKPARTSVAAGRSVACHFADEAPRMRETAMRAGVWDTGVAA